MIVATYAGLVETGHLIAIDRGDKPLEVIGVEKVGHHVALKFWPNRVFIVKRDVPVWHDVDDDHSGPELLRALFPLSPSGCKGPARDWDGSSRICGSFRHGERILCGACSS